jgi:hypothetical protein
MIENTKNADTPKGTAFFYGDPERGKSLEAFPFKALAFQLTSPSNGLSFLARTFLRGFLVVTAQFHFAEDALTLHLIFEGLQGLIDVIVTNENLHVEPPLL